MLGRAVTAVFDRALSTVGLRAAQLNVLVAIEMRGGARATEICRSLRMDKSTLSRNLSRLNRAGWVAGGAAPGRQLRLTAEGRRTIRRAQAAWAEAQAQAAGRLGEDGLQALELVVLRLRSLGVDGSARVRRTARSSKKS